LALKIDHLERYLHKSRGHDFLDMANNMFLTGWKKTHILVEEKMDAIKEKGTQAKDSQDRVQKIQWLGTEAEITYLFDQLRNEGFISNSEELWAQIERHFLNKSGKPFDKKQLSGVFARDTQKPSERKRKIEKLVKQTKEKD